MIYNKSKFGFFVGIIYIWNFWHNNNVYGKTTEDGEGTDKIVSEGSGTSDIQMDDILRLIPKGKFVEPDADAGWYSPGTSDQPFDLDLARTLCEKIDFDQYMPKNTVIQMFGASLPVEGEITIKFNQDKKTLIAGTSPILMAISFVKLSTKPTSWPLVVAYRGIDNNPVIEISTEISKKHELAWIINAILVEGGVFVNAYMMPFNGENIPQLIYSRRIPLADADKIKSITVPAGLRKLTASVFISKSAKFTITEENGCMTDD